MEGLRSPYFDATLPLPTPDWEDYDDGIVFVAQRSSNNKRPHDNDDDSTEHDSGLCAAAAAFESAAPAATAAAEVKRQTLAAAAADDESDSDSDSDAPLPLNDEQVRAASLVLDQGRSVFLSGGGGVGKSFLLRHIVKALGRRSIEVLVTASTGRASLELHDGRTLHSAFGLMPSTNLDRPPRNRPDAAHNVCDASVLVIDEVSMINARLLDYVDMVCRDWRNCPEPFGGLITLLCGDVMQLRPVAKDPTSDDAKFFFESRVWQRLFGAAGAKGVCVALQNVMRQREPAMVHALSQIRFGKQSCQFTRRFFQPCIAAPGAAVHPQAVRLFATNRESDAVNTQCLLKLDEATEQHYVALEAGDLTALKSCRVGPELVLRTGARVILVRNHDLTQGLVNGQCGTVVRFVDADDWQGLTLPRVVDAKVSVRADVRCSEGLKATGRRTFDMRAAPVVRFDNDVEAVVFPYLFSVKKKKKTRRTGAEQEFKCVRYQLPLKLSWAQSIHSSQGASYDRVDVDLSRIFVDGQCYVALSRVRTREGLVIRGLNWNRVRACPEAVAFYVRTFGSIPVVPAEVARSVLAK